jgi:ADP-ribosylglycohydrolase
MAAASFLDIEQAADLAVAVAKLTHPQPAVVSSARHFARLMVLALEGVPKENLFATASIMMPERGGFDGEDAGASEAAELLRNAANRGDAPSVLRLSRWVLLSTSTYKEAVLSAINAGGHADVIGATVGALAGAVYGARSLPPHWLQSLHARDRIETLADQLLATALARILEEPGTATA